MDDIVKDNLEDYLAGTLRGAQKAAFEAKLAESPELAVSVAQLEKTSELFADLRPPEDESWSPAPGFYGRVARVIEEEQGQAPFWLAFLQPPLARRLAFACLMWFFLLGAYVISSTPAVAPEAPLIAGRLLSTQPAPEYALRIGSDLEQNRDQMLVALIHEGR